MDELRVGLKEDDQERGCCENVIQHEGSSVDETYAERGRIAEPVAASALRGRRQVFKANDGVSRPGFRPAAHRDGAQTGADTT